MNLRFKNARVAKIVIIIFLLIVVVLPFYLLVGSIGWGAELSQAKQLITRYYLYALIISAAFAILLTTVAVGYRFMQKGKANGITKVEFMYSEMNRTSEDYLDYIEDFSVFKLFPGARSRNSFKMSIAGLYFLTALFPVLEGNYWAALVSISLPFVIFDGYDALKLGQKSIKNRVKGFRCLITSTIFIISLGIFVSILFNGGLQSRFASNVLCRLPDICKFLNIEVKPDIYYQLGINLDRKNPLPYLRMGNLNVNKGQISIAEDNYKKAIQYDQQGYESYYRLGKLYSIKSEKSKALGMFGIAQTKNPNFAPAFFEAAILLLEKGEFDEAVKLSDFAIKLDNTNHEALRAKAKILSENMNYKEALQFYDQAIKLSTKVPDLYKEKAEVLLKAGKFDESLYNFQKALELGKNDPEYNYFKGLILFEKNEFSNAVIELKKALALRQNYPLARSKLALAALYSGDAKTAESEIKKAIQSSNETAEVHFASSCIQFEGGKYKNALEEIEKAIELDKVKPNYYSFKAEILLRYSEFRKSQALIEKAVELYHNDYYTLYVQGQLMLEIEDYDSAYQAFKKSIELNPYFSRAYAGIAIAANCINNRSQSDEYLEKAIELSPNDYFNYYCESLIEFNRKLNLKAKDSINKAIEKNRNLPELYLQRYATEDALGLEEAKTESLERAEVLGVELYKVRLEKADAIKDDKEAITNIENVIMANPDIYLGYLSKAERLIKLGNFEDAMDAANHAISLNSMSFRNYLIEYHILLGKSNRNAQDDITAILSLEKLLEVNPYFSDASFYKGQIFAKQKRYEEAITLYKQTLESESNSYLSSVKKSDIYYKLSTAYSALLLSNMAEESLAKMERAKKREALETTK